MIDYDKQFNDIIAQIQAQYRGSNVAELIKGIIEIKKKGVLRAYKSLINDCLNLSTAKGDALDLWGYILGINRYVPRDSEQNAKEPFKQWNFNQSNFKHLIFLQVRDHLYHRLDDDAFRNLLLLFLQRQYIFPSPAEAQSLIDDYISDKYGEINIFDTQKMSMAVEFSFKDYPEWMRWYILLKDIIPRPAGVKIDMIEVPEPQSLGEGLRFTAEEANSSVTLGTNGNPITTFLQLEYRTDTNPNWQDYTLWDEIILTNIGSWVEMRNTGLQDTAAPNHPNAYQFFMTGKIAASGNIMYLLDKTGEKDSVTWACFYRLFYGCTNLTTAPELPATTLADYCYMGMFENCSNLTTAPSLPATNLAESCYRNMFYNCQNLTTPPSILPATTLASNCYYAMFYNCSSLTTAPELPATTLADYCYMGMFENCSNLTTAPSLPATNLAESCYRNMFYNCQNLTTPPSILPATTLASNCYYAMFYNCSSLTTAPELPATTLADRCCESMFADCTNLTTAPSILPATTLASNCYYTMFYNCTRLTTAPELPATTLADYCYNDMFRNCQSLTTAPSLPATNLAESCYNGMFYNCSSLTTAPELPATILASNCYKWMFYGCSKLKVNQNGSGTKIFTCPSTSGLIDPVNWMFSYTGGTFTDTPTAGNTYNWYN